MDLLTSRAWRERTVNCVRLIDFLTVEHGKGGGQRNGQLLAPYSQLEAFGITRRLIPTTIAEAEERGLVVVDRPSHRRPNLFRLTYYPTRIVTDTSLGIWREPTNEWRMYGVLFDPQGSV